MVKKALTKREKHDKLTELVAELFNVISEKDVLFKEKNGWYLGERQLTKEHLQELANEAEIIKKMPMWNEVIKCVKYVNNRAMFLKAKNEDDMIAGKAVLYVLKLIDDILNTACKLKNK